MTVESVRPQLALRIGITGHRWREPQHAGDERLDHHRADAVTDALRTVLARIRTAALAVKHAHPTLFSDRAPGFSLVSALAEGADELAAAVAIEPGMGYVLDIVAPYDLAAFAERCAPGTPARRLWDAARARLVLDGQPRADEPEPATQRARHEATLVETNRRLVWNCDLIIAVWDGLDARGDAGTAQVIARARDEGLPVIHVHSVHPERVTLLDASGGTASADDGLASIDTVVTRLLEPPRPADAARPKAARALQQALQDYAGETPPGVIVRHASARVYRIAQRVLSGSGTLSAIPPSPADVTVPWQGLPTTPVMNARRVEVIDPAYRRADYYASSFGARHRSTFTTIVFAAPFAVVCAWLGSQVAAERRLFFAVAELLLLVVLTTFFLRSRRLRFHEKWLDYRLLAERLRHLGFLWPLGRNSPVIRVPTHAVFTDPRPAWVNWWYRALTREAGLAPVTLDEPTVRALAGQLQRDLIGAQLAYNRETHAVAHHAKHRLHLIPWIPLLMALAAAFAHVLEHLHLLHLPSSTITVLTGIGILGPAFGAALHGFASQSGYQEAGIRTDASAQQLERFADRLSTLDLSKPLASRELGDLALSVADVMGEDLAGWRVDYLARPVNPPG